MSLKEIITGFKVNFLQHCKLEFGDYMQTHEEHTNDMRLCLIGALSLYPTGNSQGGYYFYSLTMGHIITHQRYTLLPISCEVIDHIHCKAWQENASTGLSILNHKREEILDEPVHPHNMPEPAGDNDTMDADSSYHPKDEAGSSPSLNKLETEFIAPIQVTPDELEPIDDHQVDGVEYGNDTIIIEPNNETIVAEPEVMHAEDSNLFVPVEPPGAACKSSHFATSPHRCGHDTISRTKSVW